MPDEKRLTHLNNRGEAHIVDIGDKAASKRVAVARARVEAKPATIAAIAAGAVKKGDVFAVARIAGIMAAKKTADLIPLCHPIALSKVEIDISVNASEGAVEIVSRVETTDRTGVEMEALTAASVAALTVYDMAKALDKAMTISSVQLVSKSGGKSGDFKRDNA